MPIDADFVDQWSDRYDWANKQTPFRLDGTRLADELHRRFPDLYAKAKSLKTLWDFENYLFTSVSDAIVGKHSYAADEFFLVCCWKSRRPIRFYVQNRAERIRDTTQHAFTDAEKPWQTLTALRGVGIPVASALLAVWKPDRFTVLDFRTLHTLAAHDEAVGSVSFGAHPQPWWEQHYERYLEGCCLVAERVNRPLRTVDRALWRWSRTNRATEPSPFTARPDR